MHAPCMHEGSSEARANNSTVILPVNCVVIKLLHDNARKMKTFRTILTLVFASTPNARLQVARGACAPDSFFYRGAHVAGGREVKMNVLRLDIVIRQGADHRTPNPCDDILARFIASSTWKHIEK